ncbi:MAG: DUF2059 domain-containing protein [Alphaproteobacteria bacterium]|nr:DUF2059 domain-containing protein [Alphaproteobacteria bacterium]MBV9378239.1 DUF2059 domain-containing protein [Alphaproteobacteria bacterium]MBV9815782.1 DUF2059 domain-containing protein [Alphaproteobacteria bacterium]
MLPARIRIGKLGSDMTTVAHRLGRVAGILLCVGVLQPQAAMAVDAQKHADIQVLMQETGMLANMNRTVELMLPQVIGNLKKINSNIPQAAWDDFARIGAEEFKKSLAELEEPVITIFDKNFTDDEIKQLTAFYKTPLGQKVVTQMPVVMQQSAQLGQIWGTQVGGRVAERIRAAAKQKGYEL